MILFADSGISNSPITWASVVALVIVTISQTANIVVAYLDRRDKGKNDAEKITLKQELDSLRREVTECESDRKNDRQRINDLTAKADAAAIAAATIKGQLDGANARIAAMQVDITALRDMVYKKKTGEG